MSEIGVVGLSRVFRVTDFGGVEILGGAGLVDWWVGAEDRWHVASREKAVRQATSEAHGFPETRLKVPGGDVVSRVFAIPHGSEAIAVVELENQTPVPVAVALVLSGPVGVVTAGDAMNSEAGVVLRASKPIAMTAGADDLNSLLSAVEAGHAARPGESQLAGVHGCHAAIFPLPHTATVRVVVSLDAVTSLPPPTEAPSPAAIESGWASHMRGLARFDVSDTAVLNAVESARRHLLVGAYLSAEHPFWSEGVEPGTMSLCAAALELWGHDRESHELLLAAIGIDDLTLHARRGPVETGSLLWALAERLERRADPEFETALVPWIQEAAVGLTRRKRKHRSAEADGWRAVGLASAASLLTRSTDDVYGHDFVEAVPELLGELAPPESTLAMSLAGRRLDEPSAVAPIEWLAERMGLEERSLAGVLKASSVTGGLPLSGRSQHPLASALLLIAVRTAMVDEPDGAGGIVALLSRPERSWLGSPIEGHDIPISGGSVSFGVRWHGARPALLWDMAVDPAQPRQLICPGLDPGWSDDRPRAEALLADSSIVDVAPRPLRGDSSGAKRLDPTDDPGSFD